MNDLISRQAAIDAIEEDKIDLDDPKVVAVFKATGDFEKAETQVMTCDRHIKILHDLPSAQPEQRPLTKDNYAYCAECDPEVKCLSCGHHIAERPFEIYCNIMCKWVIENDYCTMFEPGQEKMRK